MQNYGAIIDMEMLKSALNTDSREVKEITNIWLILWVVFSGILPCILITKCNIKYLPSVNILDKFRSNPTFSLDSKIQNSNISDSKFPKNTYFYRILKHLTIRFSVLFLSLSMIISLFVLNFQFLVPFFRNYYQAEFYTTPFFQIKSLVRYIKHNVLPKKEFSHISTDAKITHLNQNKILIMIMGGDSACKKFLTWWI